MTEDQPDPIPTGAAADIAQALFTDYEDIIFNHCFRGTGYYRMAEDLTYEVFEVVCEQIEEGKLPDSAGAPWLIGIARNILRANNRRIKKQQKALDALQRLPSSHYYDDDPADIVAAKLDAEEAMRILRPALNRLSQKHREILELRASLSETDVAEFLNIPVGTVKSRLSRAKEKLQESPEMAAAERKYLVDR